MVNTLKYNFTRNIAAALLAIFLLSGCQVGTRPRLRDSEFFGAPNGIRFADPDNLGKHCYDKRRGEKLGMLYTCKGGFIDMGHLREAADRTYYIAEITHENLIASNTDYSYRVIEPSRYHITVTYPDNWQQLSDDEKDSIAREVSVLAGQYLAHTSLIWHEIVTWYGFSSSGIFSEYISSFSWEDPYSDVLGTRLAAKALCDPERSYDKAMTCLIEEALKVLDVQPTETAKKAVNQVEGQWYSGGYYFFVIMKKRNFDVGLDDGLITPWLVPGICPDATPEPCRSPNLAFLSEYGFKLDVKIDPVEFQKQKIYHSIGLKKNEYVCPLEHFPVILEDIRKQAEKHRGADVTVPPKQNPVSSQN